MHTIQALVLGIVQGVTEFLPVSSSAHLVVVPWWLGWAIPSVAFDTTLHLGTIFAVILYFYRDIWTIIVAWMRSLIRSSEHSTEAILGWWIILGTIPAAIAGFLWGGFFERVFSVPVAVALFLILTGVILFAAERYTKCWRDLFDLVWVDAVVIGIAQAAAILPGISRSGVTISTGLWRGLKREQAARFSFLLSVPIILGTGFKQLLDLSHHQTGDVGFDALLVGFLAATVTGFLAIRYLLRYLQRGTLYPFAVYCWLVGLLTLFLALVD